jgi:hypothetical protein
MKQPLIDGSRLQFVYLDKPISLELTDLDIDTRHDFKYWNYESEMRGDKPIVTSTTNFFATCLEGQNVRSFGMGELCRLQCTAFANTKSGEIIYQFRNDGSVDVIFPEEKPVVKIDISDDLEKNAIDRLKELIGRGFQVKSIGECGTAQDIEFCVKMSRLSKPTLTTPIKRPSRSKK